MTIAGTRPELIRLSRIIPALDKVCDQTFVWTGQNYAPSLSSLFFNELKVRAPDRVLLNTATTAEYLERDETTFLTGMDFVGALLPAAEKALREAKPDKVLILGDTNSALTAFVAKRMGIPVYHMEAGNRCYDDRVPEEVNRRAIDACSDVLLPYTQRSRDNLLAEGVPARRIFVTGNPIYEVLQDSYFKHEREKWAELKLLEIGLKAGNYCLVTLHRAENVDEPERLKLAVECLRRVATLGLPVVVSTHPRTKDKLEALGLDWSMPVDRVEWEGITWLAPMGFHAFTGLELKARCVITDSGTVQEEACLFGVPAVTMRDTTERPETVECGSNVVTGLDPDRVLSAVASASQPDRCSWSVPDGYAENDVSNRVASILMSEVPR